MSIACMALVIHRSKTKQRKQGENQHVNKTNLLHKAPGINLSSGNINEANNNDKNVMIYGVYCHSSAKS